MNKTFNFMLALTMCVAAVVTTSCKGNDPVVPSQQEIESKIIGKWKRMYQDKKDVLTNDREVNTFFVDGKATTSIASMGKIWDKKAGFRFKVNGNVLILTSEIAGAPNREYDCIAIDDYQLSLSEKEMAFPEGPGSEQGDGEDILPPDGGDKELPALGKRTFVFSKVSADYSQDIIGLWEGVEMTGYETYGNAEARIEYRADGTYTYYKKEGDDWVPSSNVDNEYNVDGDWLATRWRPEAGKDFNYEWWDIDEIKDDTMKWSALREKEDKTRFTTTFTWKKVN